MTNEQIDESLKSDAVRTPGEWRYRDTLAKLSSNSHIVLQCHASSLHYTLSDDDGRYVAATTHPATGYAAALREVKRLRSEENRISSLVMCDGCGRGYRLRHMVCPVVGECLCTSCASNLIARLRVAVRKFSQRHDSGD